MLQHRLSRTERSRNKSGSPFQHRVHGIDDPNTRFHLPERTWFIHIIPDGYFYRPFLHHRDIDFFPGTIFQYGNRIHRIFSLQLKRNHNLMIQPVFLHISEPIGSFHLIPGFGQRRKAPFFIVLQRICIFSSFQKNTCHFIQVIL